MFYYYLICQNSVYNLYTKKLKNKRYILKLQWTTLPKVTFPWIQVRNVMYATQAVT